MIRYVLAVVLTTALLGIGLAGVDHAAAVRSEQQVESEIARLEAAAQSLAAHDDVPPPGQPGPRRVVHLDLPPPGPVSSATDSLVVEPERDRTNGTLVVGSARAHYQIDGRVTQTVVLDVRVRDSRQHGTTDTPTVDLSGETGRTTLVLELRADQFGRYVAVRSPPMS